jgi:hypothetical protein
VAPGINPTQRFAHRVYCVRQLQRHIELPHLETFAGAACLPTHGAAILQSGSPAMGVVKLPRVCELGFHSKSDEVASKGVKREGLTLWDVLPRVCGGHAALTVQPAIRVRQTLIWSRFTLCFIRARRGKRAHPISNREFAQGSRRARAADQSHWAKKSEALRF